MEPDPGETGAPKDGPAYYAVGAHTRLRDVRAILHPPYTAWHLSYVVIGSLIVSRVNWTTLAGAVVAFFLAVGVAAHALDELRGRPLGTQLPKNLLIACAALGLSGAIAIGIIAVFRLGPWFAVFIGLGVILVLGYNLELFGGRLHTDLGFALAWGAFPVLTAAYAQDQTIAASTILLACSAAFLSAAQRSLSNQARKIRRRAVCVEGRIVYTDGTVERISQSYLLAPLERALRALSWAIVILAASLLLLRLGY